LSVILGPVSLGVTVALKWVWAVLLLILLGLQARLWVGVGSLAETRTLLDRIDEQRHRNQQLKERNLVLEHDVRGLKQGTDVIEEKIRTDMGMVKEGETFFLYLPTEKEPTP
jgi:cell division protein FtsB